MKISVGEPGAIEPEVKFSLVEEGGDVVLMAHDEAGNTNYVMAIRSRDEGINFITYGLGLGFPERFETTEAGTVVVRQYGYGV